MTAAVMTGPAPSLMLPDGPDGNPIISVEYEVYGQVQGLGFPKFAKEQAEMLSIGGWVKNTKQGTIAGRLEGPKDKLTTMVQWLGNEGSPGCKIERIELRNWEFTVVQTFRNFSVRF